MPISLPADVVMIGQHAGDRVLTRVLKLLTYQLQIFLVKYEYLQSLQLCEDQGIHGKLKKPVCKCVFSILDLHGDQASSSSLVLKMSNKEDFKDFEVMTEKKDTFPPSKFITFPSGIKHCFTCFNTVSVHVAFCLFIGHFGF